MKWKRYPKYKDTGIEWLGEIPEEWGNLKICRLGTLRNGLNKDKSAYGAGKRYVTVNDLYDEGYIDQEKLRRMDVTLEEFKHYSLIEYDILFARSSVKREGVGNPGIIGKIQEKTVFAGFVIRLRVTNDKANKKYIYWLLKSKSVRDIVVAVSNTVAQTNLSQPNLKAIDICLPSINEQKNIATFLDRETSRIDNLIEKKEKQIELLKEKRAALISHAVTKGLNPNVKMKDSGIQWLGEIPEEWEVKKLKQIADTKFSNIDKKTKEGQQSVRICNYKDVYYNKFITSDLDLMIASASKDEINKFNLLEGDVIITKDSESWEDIAIPAYVPSDLPGVVCGYHLSLIRANRTILNGRFLFRALLSHGVNHQYRVEATGITRYGLGKYWLDNSLFPIPPLEQQHAIAAYLDRETSKIDALIEKILRSVELLKEYRTALISAAVTGKIDVRGEV